MVKIEEVTYEQARSDFLKAEMEKAQNRMMFWQTKIKKAKSAIAEMEAHDNASNAGWEYNYYKDALKALEDNAFQYETGFVKGFEAAQPKWISVEERLPEPEKDVLVLRNRKRVLVGYYSEDCEAWAINDMIARDENITHWMPLPEPPKEEA